MKVSGIVHVFMGYAVPDWSGAVEFTNYGGPAGILTTVGCIFIFLILLKIGLKGDFMCRDNTCEIIYQSDHLFNSYDQKFKCSIYVDHWMRLVRFRMKILAASDTESDYVIHCTWALSFHLYR